MSVKNDASLRGRIRAYAKDHQLHAQEVLQMYLFVHFLRRRSKSDYASVFVLKGGLLIASYLGITRRTTMDMDATVVGMPMDKDSVVNALEEICSKPVEDDMEYELERVSPIHDLGQYANWRAHLRVKYGRINAPTKIDKTTGDSIVPAQERYEYPPMFDEGSIDAVAYLMITVLTEKIETILTRGCANTRGRDNYDVFTLYQAYGERIDYRQLHEALEATFHERIAPVDLKDYDRVLTEMVQSGEMHGVWDAYAAVAPFARDITLEQSVEAVRSLCARAIDAERPAL